MLYLAGIIITFFLAVILLSKKGKTTADNILAAWLCIIGFHLLLFYGYITGEIYNYPHVLGLHFPLPLLHGPFLYMYTLAATRDDGLPKRYWLHFIPALVALAALTRFYFMSGEKKIAVYKNEGAGYEAYTGTILIASIISGFVYVWLSHRELRKYRKTITEEFSDTEKINLNWLRYLIYGILAIWLILLLGGGDPLIFSAVVVFVSLLGYFGIKHTGIFTYRQTIIKEVITTSPVYRPVEKPVAETEPVTEQEDAAIDQASTRTKYEKSGLQREAAEKIHLDLDRVMRTEKIFKQEELSLAQLARQLDVHPNNLSQVINTYENKSFYDYINTLRIEEFKSLALLPENSRYTLLSLAFECGFNSKTAFNRNFKKITGQSPSEYLKEISVQLVNE